VPDARSLAANQAETPGIKQMKAMAALLKMEVESLVRKHCCRPVTIQSQARLIPGMLRLFPAAMRI